jgi:hypothetical protein
MATEEELDAFLKRIDERLRDSPGASHRGKHRTAFIALRPFIERALAHGHTFRATWAVLREERRLSMSYQTFRLHCRRAGIRPAVPTAAPCSHDRPDGYLRLVRCRDVD